MRLDGSLHDEEPGEEVDEDSPHPGRHQVSLGRPEVDVEHHHRHADAENTLGKASSKAFSSGHLKLKYSLGKESSKAQRST